VEGEVLSLETSISKAISVAAFFGLTLAPVDGPGRREAHAGDPAPHEALPAPLSAATEHDANDANAKAKSAEPMADPPADPAAVTGKQGPCASGMVLVDGDYCPDVDEACLKWIDPPPYQNLRCAEFASPTKCKVARQHRRFCVDRNEYAESVTGTDAKDALPLVNKSWTDAQSICQTRGARLCKESEWEFACEGPDMNPYPYGFKRDSSLCNHDRTDLGGAEEKLTDHRAPISAFPSCVSAFGAHDMIGNVDEWVEREGQTAPHRSSLRGGWWLPGRNRCRAATLHHEETYSAKQVGFRCCADAPADKP
jgi:sulfatase modifying factor 1